MNKLTPPLKQAIEKLRRKLGFNNFHISPITEGANGIIYKIIVITGTNKTEIALKYYKTPHKEDKTSRLLKERQFLEYANKNNIENVPKVISSSEHEGWIAMSWMQGDRLRHANKEDLKNVTIFLENVNRRRETSIIKNYQAPDSLETLAKSIERINSRIERLKSAENGSISKDLIKTTSKILERYQQSKTETQLNKPFGFNIISPSDMGIHNTLKTKMGLNFIDFEYAGMDSAIKLTTDWAVNPKYILDAEKESYLIAEICNKLEFNEKDFIEQYLQYKPLGQILWSLILCKKINDKNKDGLEAHIKKYIKSIDLS